MRTASLITVILLSGLYGCSKIRAADTEFAPIPEVNKPKSSAVPEEKAAAKPKSSTASEATTVITKVDDSNFDFEVKQFRGLVLVDFTATWCMPCRRMAPKIEDLAMEYYGRVKVVTIDVDQAPKLVQRFGASDIPCLILFNNGKIAYRYVGEPSAEMWKRWAEKFADH